jgi:hypothetical protein
MKLTMTKQMNTGVIEKYLISWFEMLYFDPLVMSSLGSFLDYLGTVVGLLHPFHKLSNLDFPFCAGCLHVHVPPLYSSESFVFKFYEMMTSLPVD